MTIPGLPKDLPPLPESYIFGSIVACRSAVQAMDKGWIISGTFNRIEVGIQELRPESTALPLISMQLYMRLLVPVSRIEPVEGYILLRVLSWDDKPDGRVFMALPFKTDVYQPSSGGTTEGVVSLENPLLPLDGRPIRKSGKFVVRTSVELWAENRPLSVIGIEAMYEFKNGTADLTSAPKDSLGHQK